MNTIFSIQQAILNYNRYHGFSVGFRDIILSPESMQLNQRKNDQMMLEGYKITQ